MLLPSWEQRQTLRSNKSPQPFTPANPVGLPRLRGPIRSCRGYQIERPTLCSHVSGLPHLTYPPPTALPSAMATRWPMRLTSPRHVVTNAHPSARLHFVTRTSVTLPQSS